LRIEVAGGDKSKVRDNDRRHDLARRLGARDQLARRGPFLIEFSI
jgi:hypothetical protein